MFKSKSSTFLLALLMVISLFLSLSPVGNAAETKHVKFSVSMWSGDWLPTYVPKILLEDNLGYTTEVLSLSIPAGMAAIAAGEVEVTTIVWMPNNQPLVDKYLGQTIEDLGTIYPECLQAIFIPKWVSQQYGIKSISDLDNPQFAKMFDIDNDGKGDWLGCDPGWLCAKLNDQCIALYGLDKLYVQMMGEEHFLLAAMAGRMKKHEPVLISQFYPHVMFIDYPKDESMVVLDDPKHFWFTAHVQKFGNKKWIAGNPKAAELIRQVKMTAEDVMWMMKETRAKGDKPATLEAIAREWITKNKASVDSWLAKIK